jgi:hypothetical protein
MNQQFGFKPQFKEKILNGTKRYTTREATDYRLKCNIGDLMYCATGVRTKEYDKFATAKVVNRWRWEIQFPDKCPVGIDWDEFAIAEGFEDYNGLAGWFCKRLITWEFEVL